MSNFEMLWAVWLHPKPGWMSALHQFFKLRYVVLLQLRSIIVCFYLYCSSFDIQRKHKFWQCLHLNQLVVRCLAYTITGLFRKLSYV